MKVDIGNKARELFEQIIKESKNLPQDILDKPGSESSES